MLHITDVKYLKNYCLWLVFDNGQKGEVDLKKELWGAMFEPLKNIDLFSTVKVDSVLGTIVWKNGADLAPEYLLELVEHQNKKAA